MSGKNGSDPSKKELSAEQQISNFAIEYVKSNEVLLSKARELGHIDWRTIDIPKFPHMTVFWAGYNEEAVLLDIVVRDWFIRQLQVEYVKGQGQEPPQEGEARDS